LRLVDLTVPDSPWRYYNDDFKPFAFELGRFLHFQLWKDLGLEVRVVLALERAH
jgi:hypothetical protein